MLTYALVSYENHEWYWDECIQFEGDASIDLDSQIIPLFFFIGGRYNWNLLIFV